MSQSLEQIYQQIGDYIIQAINEQWTAAWITVDVVEGDVFSLNGFYMSKDGKENQFRIHPLVPHLFMEIRKKTKNDEAKGWRNARFDLHPDGKFNLHFGY